jgi:PAS domain S-box-containing protein
MFNSTDQADSFRFLNSGGETGALIRAIDWSNNPVGPVEAWPQSLKTTLSIILNSRFPMFLFWGPELICFYNDAYRPSLGNEGKHPTAMGQRAEDCWPEIWEFIKPLIDQVLAGGEASWHEDQLLPIFRNGKMEDVYWTFSYSPVNDESGTPAGVFVTCSETTDKVKTLEEIRESKDELDFAINAAELGAWELNPRTNRFTGNDRLKQWFGLKPDEEIALSLAIDVIADKDKQSVVDAIQAAMHPSSGGAYNIEYTIINPVDKKERIVRAIGKAMFADNEVLRFNGILQDITEEVLAREKLIESEKNFRNLMMQAPVGIAILKGEDFFVELANDSYLEIVGKTREAFVNKPLWEGLPEAKTQGFDQLLIGVMETGESHTIKEYEVTLFRKGKVEKAFINFVYEPIKTPDGTVDRIMVIVVEVTDLVEERHRSEDAEERARLAADAVNMGVFDVDLNTGDMTTSSYFDMIFGFEHHVSRDEFIAVIHPDDLPIRAKAHAEALVSGRLFYEARVVYEDKSVHWVRVEGKVYYDNGAPFRILGTLLDITEQRKAREEQRKLITLADNSVDLNSILNLDGTNSYINEAGKKMLGFESDLDVLKTPISELHTPEDLDFVQTEVLPSVMSKGRWSGIMNVRHLKTGEVFPVFNNCIRIDDPISGEPIAVGAVMRDMRPEIASKQALAKSEELFRSITTAAPTALWMSDENGNITYVNQTWVDWTGLPFETHLNDGWLTAIIAEDRDAVSEKFRQAMETKSIFETEFRIKHSDKTIQYNSEGDFIGHIGSCSDITEQKNLQQQKDDFIGIASHELKTPVTSIKAYTQVLERMVVKTGQTKEAQMISKMDGQLNRLTSLIGDLLDVTKINSGKLQFNDRTFDFNSLVQELMEDLQRTTNKHTLVENLKETGMIYADRERIGQVITNLITNAIKYSPHADKIIIHTDLKDGEVNVCVEDFGIGISKDKLEKVFEQFYRVSGDMQHTFPGLGLGLYISSEIIKREGGRIWVESIEGKGSTFCFSLPVNYKNFENN